MAWILFQMILAASVGLASGFAIPTSSPTIVELGDSAVYNAQYEAVSVIAVGLLLVALVAAVIYEFLITGGFAVQFTKADQTTTANSKTETNDLEVAVNIWDDGYIKQLNPVETLGITLTCLNEYYKRYDHWKSVPPDFVVPNDASWPSILRHFPLGRFIGPLPCGNRGIVQSTGIEKLVQTHIMSAQQGTDTDDVKEESDDRQETWYELFYDLVFVAAALQLGLIIKYDHRLVGVAKAGVLFLILRSTWDHLVLYQNRFHTDDLTHVAYYTIQSMGAFIIALNLQIEENGDEHMWERSRHQVPIAMTCTLLRIVTVIMYMKLYKRSSYHKNYLYRIITHTAFSSAIFAVSTFTSTDTDNYAYLYVWGLAIFVERPLMFILAYIWNREDQILMSQYKSHFIHRNGIFFMLILGEAVIQLVQASSEIFDLALYARELLGFAVVFNVGSVYYEQQMREANCHVLSRSWGLGYLWIELQSLLSMCVLFYAVGVKLVFHDYIETKNVRDQFLMCIFASVSLCLMYGMNIMHDGMKVNFFDEGAPSGHHIFRFVMSILIGVTPYFSNSTTMTVFFLFVITTFLVIHDILIRTARMAKIRSLLKKKGKSTEILTWKNAMDSTKRFMDDSMSSKHGLTTGLPTHTSSSYGGNRIGHTQHVFPRVFIMEEKNYTNEDD